MDVRIPLHSSPFEKKTQQISFLSSWRILLQTLNLSLKAGLWDSTPSHITCNSEHGIKNKHMLDFRTIIIFSKEGEEECL